MVRLFSFLFLLSTLATAQLPRMEPAWEPVREPVTEPDGAGGVVTFSSLLFNTDDEAIVTHAVSLNPDQESFTISFWMKTTTAGQEILITKSAGFGDGWRIQISDNRIFFTVIQEGDQDQISGGTTVNDGQWHFVQCVIDKVAGARIRIYVDGAADSVFRNISTVTIDNDTDMYWGKASTGAEPYTGELTQVRIAKGLARTEAQSATDMQRVGFIGWETEYWQMQPGTGTTVTNEVNAANSAAFGAGAAAPDWTDRLTKADLL